jgi:2-aminomuconate deaminase
MSEIITEKINSTINAAKAPEPVGAYPHARRFGDLLFLSGVGPRKPGTKQIPGVELDGDGHIMSYDVVVQTESVIENIKIILEASGSSLSQVIDVQVFLTNMKADFNAYNEVYAKHFTSVGATRTTIEVGALPTPIAVEFKVIAAFKPESQS